MLNSKERFSSRVDDYVKYRPSYPHEVVDLLANECGLTPSWTIADIGSGPGNLSRLFLENGNRLYGVEPNKEMREAGERLMGSFDGFVSVNGTAETTGLADKSVELVTAGQAFHWFDPVSTKVEFQRILKPQGYAALIWNDRDFEGRSRFASEYERILREFAPDYGHVKDLDADDRAIKGFFGDGLRLASFRSAQHFGEKGFLGRALSSSYVPQQGTHGHEEILAALQNLFAEVNENGTVTFDYDTKVFYGQLL